MISFLKHFSGLATMTPHFSGFFFSYLNDHIVSMSIIALLHGSVMGFCFSIPCVLSLKHLIHS